MHFHRLNCILIRDTHLRAEQKWRTLTELELLLHTIPLAHLRRQFALRRAIRTYRKLIK